MANCVNESMRDLLPLLAHAALDAGEEAQLRAHIASCASCALELSALTSARAVFAAATPQVDIAAIVSRLPAPPAPRSAQAGVRPVLTVSRPTRGRIFGLPSYAVAAAASLVLVATLSLTVLRPVFFDGVAGVDVVRVDSGPVGMPSVPVDLVGGADLADLNADELSALLDELNSMEATIASEPITMRQSLTSAPEDI